MPSAWIAILALMTSAIPARGGVDDARSVLSAALQTIKPPAGTLVVSPEAFSGRLNTGAACEHHPSAELLAAFAEANREPRLLPDLTASGVMMLSRAEIDRRLRLDKERGQWLEGLDGPVVLASLSWPGFAGDEALVTLDWNTGTPEGDSTVLLFQRTDKEWKLLWSEPTGVIHPCGASD